MFALDSNQAVQINNNQHRHVIELRPLEINGLMYISLYPTNTGLIGAIQELELAYYEEAGVYIIPDGHESLNTLFAHFKGRAWLDLTELQAANERCANSGRQDFKGNKKIKHSGQQGLRKHALRDTFLSQTECASNFLYSAKTMA